MKETQNKPQFHIGGIVLISLGVLFLLNNFGIIPWSIWAVLVRAWPLILVFLGLEAIMGRPHKSHGLLFLLVLLALGFLLWRGFVTHAFNANQNSWVMPLMPQTPTPRMHYFNY